MIYPQEAWFDWQNTKFKPMDLNMMINSLWKMCRVFYTQLSPSVNMEEVCKGLRYEFVDEPTEELRKYGAIGLSYPNRCISYFPNGMDKFMFALYSGIESMELAHTIIYRLTQKNMVSNDLVHWLYNENHLIQYDYVSDYNFRYIGGHLNLVIPDLGYGWKNREEIMSGIKSGKYKEGKDKYWSDPNGAPAAADMSAAPANEHELEHIKNFLLTGNSQIHI